jgi:hypothetical protein
LRDLREFLFGFFVPERVEEGHAAGEGLLHGRVAGDGKVNGAELSLGEFFVVMMLFVVVGKSGEVQETHEEEQTYEAFHKRPQERCDEILITRGGRVKLAAVAQTREGSESRNFFFG